MNLEAILGEALTPLASLRPRNGQSHRDLYTSFEGARHLALSMRMNHRRTNVSRLERARVIHIEHSDSAIESLLW